MVFAGRQPVRPHAVRRQHPRAWRPQVRAFHVPGHTPACMAYLIGDALFVGDTLFMPDAGTARCDFPGGDAKSLYESCQRLLALPDDTRVFVCHDYQPGAEISHSSRRLPSNGPTTSCGRRHFGG